MVLGSGVFSPAAARFLSVFRISVFCCLFFFFPGGRPAAPLSLSARVVRGCPDTRVPGGRRHLQVATPPSPFRHWRSSPLPGPLTHALPCSPAATPPEGHARRPSLDPLPLPPSLSLQNVLPPRTATGRPSISSAQKRHPNSPSPRVRGGLPPLGRYIERQWPRPPGIQAPDGLCGRYTVYHPDDPIRGGCIPLVRARKCGTFSHSLRPGACGRRCRIVLWVGPVVNLPGGVPAFCPGAGRPAAGR